MYQIAICDDESRILNNIYTKVRTCFEEQEIQAEYFCTEDSKTMMEYLRTKPVDVLFLDIDMPYFSGMDIAAYLNENKLQTILVFVTSQEALVYKTFAYRPFGFIRKTYMDEELNELTERIKKELNDRKQDLVISKGQEVIRILIQDIFYIEAEGNYLNVYTKNDTIRIRETMTNMENELGRKGFIRCHKGYLINAEYVGKLRSSEIDLQCDGISQSVPVGRSYEKEVRRKIMEFIRTQKERNRHEVIKRNGEKETGDAKTERYR